MDPTTAGHRRLRSALWVSAATLAAAALVIALWRVESGDTYCGTALYDTVTARPCSSSLLWRRVLSGLCAGGAVVAVFAAALVGADRVQRRLRAVSVGLACVASAAALVAVNRLLQPTRSDYCGSVLNRHHTYDTAIEDRCNHLLAPYRATAVVALVVAVIALGWGVVLAVRSRSRHPDARR